MTDSVGEYSRGEDLFCAVSHALGAVFSLIATVVLLVKTVPEEQWEKAAIFGVYGVAFLRHFLYPPVTLFRKVDIVTH